MRNFLTENGLVLFQGDSITDCGRSRTDDGNLGAGYPAKIAEIWRSRFPGSKLKFLNRGVSGDRAVNLLERYDADFKAPKPALVSILIGVNDTWR
ncbi:MAG: GDSL-type esterase/lipase family protein, partial [Treponema sp.]|nr:GDSL-type esterase/lipase family protein [Treponema sp.]